MTRANQARLARIYSAAVAAVEPGRLIRRHLARRDGSLALVRDGRTVLRLDRGLVWVVAAGKAAPAMVRAALPLIGERLAGGVVASPAPVRSLPAPVSAFAAGHPLPNRRSLAAGRATWRLLGRAREGDRVLVLLSGGASSLLVLPAAGITLEDKVRTTDLLLRAGASIAEVNAVRKHLSELKGGGLARRACPARVVALLLSDVIGSSAAIIGSGPAAPDPTTFADAWRVLERYHLLDRAPAAIRRRLALGRRGRLRETPKPGTLRSRHVVVGDLRLALAVAAERARGLGYEPRILTASLRGETRAAARRLAIELRRPRSRVGLLAGGETTVRVTGGGKGGCNLEFALVLAQEIGGLGGVWCLSAGTDGIDGPTDAAGAFVDGATLSRARRAGLDPGDFLERNDSYTFFARLGDLFEPGPTGTNVMDLKIALVGSARG